jgi:hypothetical protein
MAETGIESDSLLAVLLPYAQTLFLDVQPEIPLPSPQENRRLLGKRP